MSYRDPGNIAPNPPALQRRSSGFYVAVSLGVVVFLLVVGFGIYVGNMSAALKAPLDKAAVLKSMAGVPVIDDGVFDELQTKIQMRVVLPTIRGMYPSNSAAVAAYRTFSHPELVMPWYDQAMAARNYVIHKEADEATAPAVTFQHRYDRDNEIILVQAQRAPNKEDTSLILIRFSGVTGKIATESSQN